MREIHLAEARLIAGHLPDQSLTSMVLAGAEEMHARGLELPDAIGLVTAHSFHNPHLSLVDPFEQDPPLTPTSIENGRLMVDYTNRLVTIDGEPHVFSPRRFDTLAVLAANLGKLVHREFILETVWPETPHKEAHKAHPKISCAIHHLRRQLGKNCLGHPINGLIRTQPGIGWVMLESQNS